ncbi:DNA internalization-related competence protein ComEC/Rec2 [Pontibacter sp. JAM-7]|uniref:DNA internalization-related competence protein ComEC/Rec2 n=1 Tax=Pontibacter sp. JAM-7 TaxID=3366581 RepID=UPI003AF9D51B
MRSRMICYVAGIFGALHLNTLIPLSGCIFIALLVVCLLRQRVVVNLVLFLLGLLWASLWAHWQLGLQLPAEMNRTDWLLTGQIIDLPHQSAQSTRFTLQVEQAELQGKTSDFQPERVRLSWYQPEVPLLSGMQIQVNARLKVPRGSLNPQGFDYEKLLLEQSIAATGYVRGLNILHPAPGWSVDRWRQQLNQQLKIRYPADVSALLQALTTGTRSGLGDQQWLTLQQTGTVHLAIISGMHIGLLALVGWWLGRLLGCLPGLGGKRWPPYVTALLLAAGYVVIGGAGIPSQRAFVMLAVLLVTGWRLRLIDHWTRWWLALAAVLTVSPIAIFNTGCWLSFFVVAVLIVLYQCGSSRLPLLKIQVMLLPAMLPLSLLFFSGVSLAAPVINLLAIPWISVLVPLLLADQLVYQAGITLLQPTVLWLAERFWWVLAQVAAVPWSYLNLPVPEPRVMLPAVAGVLLMVLPVGGRYKLLALILFVPLLLPQHNRQKRGDFDAVVFDVGQGLAVWVMANNYHLLYDLGPIYRSGSRAFDWAVLPALRAKAVSQVDTLVLSHDDSDHAGGYSALSERIEVATTYASYPLATAQSQYCRRGVAWQHSGVHFEFLAGSEGTEDNERSCVLLVAGAHCTLLLTGDIGSATEQRLDPAGRSLSWLVASHHGSRFSNSQAFLQGWRPEVVIYSAGFANPYNHPHPDVVNRVENISARQFNTAFGGAVKLSVSADGKCLATPFIREQPRFWR